MRLIALVCLLLLPAAARAQDAHTHESSGAPGWHLTWGTQVFVTFNAQVRKFTDFHQVESTGMVMASARRAWTSTSAGLHLMLSPEPFTMRKLGSAQVFQEGESFGGLPLRDYQHPHDLFMAIEGDLTRRLSPRSELWVRGGPVSAPALGPTAFMHRPSAMVHPTSPLTHHVLDSSHITHGAVTLGGRVDAWSAEASVFQGREPDEFRRDLDLGPLDSVAGRVAWTRGPWRAQASAAHVVNPEPLEPSDVTRVTASLEFSTTDPATKSTRAWTIAVGRNGRANHDEWGALFEVTRPLSVRWRLYGRAEIIDRFILVDFDHAARTGEERHFRSRVGALLAGAERRLHSGARGTVALAGDVTLHHTPANLRDSYGAPVSVHLFLRLTR
jgi:hypothetical protein